MDLLCQLLTTVEMTPPTDSGLYIDGCVSALVGRMSEDRLALIRMVIDTLSSNKLLSLPHSGQLFHRLDIHKSGVVLVDDVSKFFNKRDGLPVGRGQRSGTEVWEDLLECLFGRVASISYEVGPELRGVGQG